MRPPYPVEIVPLIPEFLTRRRAKFTYPLRAIEQLGIDRPAFSFVIGGVALQPDEGAHISDLFNPYQVTFDQWNGPAAAARGAGLVDEVGGKWRLTAKGRELAARVRGEADAYLKTLAPISQDELRRLAELLGRSHDTDRAVPRRREHPDGRARERGIRALAGARRLPHVCLA